MNQWVWKDADVQAMKTMQVESTYQNGDKATYTKVLISDLLSQATDQ